jgi:hypothetical protein
LPIRPRNFSVFSNAQIRSEAHPASYSINSGSLYPPKVKRQRLQLDRSFPDIAEVKKCWSYTPTSTYAFMAQARIILTLFYRVLVVFYIVFLVFLRGKTEPEILMVFKGRAK